jgi:hypothetical protein
MGEYMNEGTGFSETWLDDDELVCTFFAMPSDLRLSYRI